MTCLEWIDRYHPRGRVLIDPEHPEHPGKTADERRLMAERYREAFTAFALGQAVPEPPRPDPADILELVHGCDYRGPQVQGGCHCLHLCLAGRGRGPGGNDQHWVSVNDCFACVREPSWP